MKGRITSSAVRALDFASSRDGWFKSRSMHFIYLLSHKFSAGCQNNSKLRWSDGELLLQRTTLNTIHNLMVLGIGLTENSGKVNDHGYE